MVAQIQMRRDSAADWASANPVLAEGEFGFETDTLKYKIGDGATGWNSLEYGVFDGFAPGKRFQFSTTTTDSDPGAGFLRLNNATPASATQIFIDNADYAGATVTAWLDRLDNFGDTGDRGILLIQRASDPDVYLEYQVTGSVVDGTGYRKVSVTHIASVGSISNNDLLSVTFLPAGVASSGDFKADGSVPMTGTLDTDGNDINQGGGDLLEVGNLVGQVCYFAVNAPPTGFLKANGALVSRTTYAALFAVIGTTFGAGNGSTTFALPDLRGEFLRGWDDSRGVDTGRVFGSAQAATRHPYVQANSSPVLLAPVNVQPVNFDAVGGNVTRGYTSILTEGGTVPQYYTSRPNNVALLACIRF